MDHTIKKYASEASTNAGSRGPDQSSHLSRLIRAFLVRLQKHCVLQNITTYDKESDQTADVQAISYTWKIHVSRGVTEKKKKKKKAKQYFAKKM